MASVFKCTYKRPVPDGAEIFRRRKQLLARFKNKKGRTEILPVTPDRKFVIHERRCWYIAYTNEYGQRRTTKGYMDREASEQKARDLERRAERKRSGMPVVDAEKLQTPFAEVLDVYLADLERAKRDDMYVYNIRKRMEKLARECDWPTVASVRSQALVRWLSASEQHSLAPRTLNDHIAMASTFIEWCVAKGYLEGNPLAGMIKADEFEKRRVRRGLAEDQLRKLLKVSNDRLLVYLTAMKTGLRKDELRKLQRGDVLLDAREPHIRFRGTANKARREDTIPLDPELVDALRKSWPANASPTDPVFPRVPSLKAYKKDLERAKIPYRDEQGRQADFHSLRMSYNMLLARKGVPPRVAMQLMRHTDIRLTMKAYTDPTLLDMAGAIEKLPRLTGAERPSQRSVFRGGAGTGARTAAG